MTGAGASVSDAWDGNRSDVVILQPASNVAKQTGSAMARVRMATPEITKLNKTGEKARPSLAAKFPPATARYPQIATFLWMAAG